MIFAVICLIIFIEIYRKHLLPQHEISSQQMMHIKIKQFINFTNKDPFPSTNDINHYDKDNGYIPKNDIAVVAVVCHERISITQKDIPYPLFLLHCNPKTNHIDCHEAVPYLQFIYDNYDTPPAKKIFFVHGHRFSWHYQTNIVSRILQMVTNGIINEFSYGALFDKYWIHEAPWVNYPDYGYLFRYVYANTSMWEHLNATNMSFNCCATFFVDSRNFKLRPREEYLTIIQRLRNYSIESKDYDGTHLNDPAAKCGRLLEYSWHLLLNNNPVVDRTHANPYFWKLRQAPPKMF
ncbi:hypothetical protein TRFO_28404 [Tritrichomonas foetus]|uniref:Uncharacterized protein n=1 Tax=Tritrichomonas foetus TaxID=1144522 RepID=A0A1J4JYD8_9EUKA|nr:hypothetical protein TRFO_28404 [Tritrichomonas foetus]|eukprot:OHT04175.1 hypothetical protein TRFO_28404 [Tritrichomonas foetus]